MDPQFTSSDIWLIDGFNVLHAGVLRGRDRAGWWKPERQQQMIDRAIGFDLPHTALWIIFDSTREDESVREKIRIPIGIEIVHAPSADDWLVQRVKGKTASEKLIVVSADKQVVSRCLHHGAQIARPGFFLEHCPEPCSGTIDSDI